MSITTARNVTLGQAAGPRSQAVLERMINDAGREVVATAYRVRMEEAAKLARVWPHAHGAGALIGVRCWAPADLNTPRDLEAGKVTFDFDWSDRTCRIQSDLPRQSRERGGRQPEPAASEGA